MVRAAVSVGWIAVTWQDDFGLKLLGASNGRVKVGDFKPEEHTVSSRKVGIADRSVMMLDFPVVQLKDERTVRHEAFVMWAAVITLAAEEALIPATAGFDVSHANKRLWTHKICASLAELLGNSDNDAFGSARR